MTDFARVFQPIPLRLNCRLISTIRYLQRLFIHKKITPARFACLCFLDSRDCCKLLKNHLLVEYGIIWNNIIQTIDQTVKSAEIIIVGYGTRSWWTSIFLEWTLKWIRRIDIFESNWVICGFVSQAEASGLSQNHEPDRLSVLPLWISIQTIGEYLIVLPLFSLIRDFGKQNTRGNVSKISLSLTCYWQTGSKSTNCSH